MASPLTVADLKALSANLLAFFSDNDSSDANSPKLVEMTSDDFKIERPGEPALDREKFAAYWKEMMETLQGQFSIEPLKFVAELDEGGAKGGQCWVYSKKTAAGQVFYSIDMLWFNAEGKLYLVNDLHGPRGPAPAN